MNRGVANMAIRVECHAGYRGDEEPRAFWLGGRRLEVVELADRWLDPAYRYFKVRADDGDLYILRRDELSGDWTLGAYTRAASQPPGASGAASA